MPLVMPPMSAPHVRRLPLFRASVSERPASPEKFDPTKRLTCTCARAADEPSTSTSAVNVSTRITFMLLPLEVDVLPCTCAQSIGKVHTTETSPRSCCRHDA